MTAILDARGNPIRRGGDGARPVRGRYDAAQNSEETRRQWAEVDHLSARAANSPEVRRRLRDRTRYEVENNSWASGVADALADFMVGDGPKLQVMTEDRELNKIVEGEWCDWAEQALLADKLWMLRRVRAVDGESFLLLDTDDDYSPVTLDVRAYEAEQVATPYAYPIDPHVVDGIELNSRFKPKYYHLLEQHPGDTYNFMDVFKFTRIPARLVIHWFRATRPGQYRGIPEFTQSLALFANLRRYRDATIAAAETAASFAAVLYTENPAEYAEPPEKDWEKVPIDRRMLTTVPAGWKMNQFKPEQPSTGHPDFVRVCLTELATGHGTTYEIASSDYSNVNYSSGKLGQQRFQRSVELDRNRMERNCLNRILRAWLEEAVALGLVPDVTSRADGWAHRWLWPEIPAIDPLKEANAGQIELKNYMTTFSEQCARDGVDREARIAEIARDVEDFAAIGLPSPYAAAAPASARQQPATDQQDQGQPPGGEDDVEPADSQDQGGRAAARQALVHRNGQLRP